MLDTREHYTLRVNVVQDYIEKHIANSFTLEELSSVAGFSKYHFHRIFSAVVGETAYSFINRIRLEKAAIFLLSMREKSVTDIALDLGYSDSAVFARAFKRHYGVSASEYKNENSNKSKAGKSNSSYTQGEVNNKRSEYMSNVSVRIEDVPQMEVIYLRHAGAYSELGLKFQQMIGKLYNWGMERRVLIQGETKLLAIYHDNPNITEDDKRRTSIGITVPQGTTPDGEFNKLIIDGGKYAIGHFEIDHDSAPEQHSAAWDYMFGKWLLESGREPADNPAFEVYVNDPNTHPERKHIVDIYLPVK